MQSKEDEALQCGLQYRYKHNITLRKDNDPDEFLKQFEQELDRDESSQGVTKATQPMLDDIDQIMESVNQEAANDTAEMETSAVEKTAEQKEDEK